jgi:hypothetical protein
VFAGGCTAESAAAVLGREVGETADLLVALVDRSIVAPRTARGHTRYGVLEPVRARAQQRLRERGLLGAARRAHAGYFAGLTARAWAGLRTPEAGHWLQTLDHELANLRAACRWSLDTDGGETGLRLLAPLYIYAWSRMPAELSDWAEAACGAPAASGHPALPAVLALAATAAWRRGDLAHAARLAEQATLTEGSPEAMALAFKASGDVSFWEGRLEVTIARNSVAKAAARAAGDIFLELLCEADIALARISSGDDATVAADELCGRAEALDAPWIVAFACYTAGEARLKRAPQQALPRLRRAVQLARRTGDRFIVGAAGLSAMSIEVRHGDPAAALSDLAGLLDEWHRAGSWIPTWMTMRLCIGVFVRLGEHEPAAQLIGAMHASTTAGVIHGAEAERLAHAEAALRSRLASYDTLVSTGATLGDDGAVTLARNILSGLLRSASVAGGRTDLQPRAK